MLRAPAFTACLARVFATLLLVTPARAAEPLAPLLPGDAMVERMLRAAKLGPTDYLIDLGTGDGRVVLAATRRFGAHAHGIDTDATVIALNTQRAQSMGLAGRASFAKGDALEADLARASVVVVSSPVVSTTGGPASQLGLRLFALKPGSRVLTLQAGLGEWAPDEVLSVDGRTAYLWIVPALANGMWQLRLGGPGSRRDDRLRITQRYQTITGEVLAGGDVLPLSDATLRGDLITFAVSDRRGNVRRFFGHIQGNRISGTSQAAGGATRKWEAQRMAPR
jgi:hypothetical protein